MHTAPQNRGLLVAERKRHAAGTKWFESGLGEGALMIGAGSKRAENAQVHIYLSSTLTQQAGRGPGPTEQTTAASKPVRMCETQQCSAGKAEVLLMLTLRPKDPGRLAAKAGQKSSSRKKRHAVLD